jgi:hypothetical protein
VQGVVARAVLTQVTGTGPAAPDPDPDFAIVTP